MVAQIPKVLIECMTLADLNACWALDQRCFNEGEAYDRDTVRYLLSNPQSISYKMTSIKGEMIGFVLAMIDLDSTGHIIAICIDPEYQGSGLGRQLMQMAEKAFNTRGVRLLRLEVRVSNRHAQHLYVKMGYIIVDRILKYYTNGEDGYLMLKSFDGDVGIIFP